MGALPSSPRLGSHQKSVWIINVQWCPGPEGRFHVVPFTKAFAMMLGISFTASELRKNLQKYGYSFGSGMKLRIWIAVDTA
jgi:hypothetical protein